MAVAVAALPAASNALALNVCVVFEAVVVSQVVVYGADVSPVPSGLPSSRNCTLVTPTLSEAFADTFTVSNSVSPLEGTVIETDGGCVSTGAVPPSLTIVATDGTPEELTRNNM